MYIGRTGRYIQSLFTIQIVGLTDISTISGRSQILLEKSRIASPISLFQSGHYSPWTAIAIVLETEAKVGF